MYKVDVCTNKRMYRFVHTPLIFVHTYNISTIWGLSRGIMHKCPGKQENSNPWSMLGYGNIVIYYTIIVSEVT